MKRLAALLAALYALGLADAAQAAPSATQLGTAQAWNGAVVTFTLGGTTVAANDYIIVSVVQDSGLDSSGAVTDTALDNFNAGPHCNVGGFETQIRIFYALSPSGLTTGNTVVYTSTGGTPFQGMNVTKVTGLATSSVVDGTSVCASANTTRTDAPSGTVTPSQSGDLFYGVAANHSHNAMTNDAAYGTPPNASGWASNIGTGAVGGTLVEAGTTAHSFDPTAASFTGWASALMAFKASGGAPPAAVCSLALLGVGVC